MPNLTISIVNYNAGQYLLKTLKSVSQILDEAATEVWVVDNASVDGSLRQAQDKFPQFNYLINEENLGFGKAHNRILRQLQTEYVLLLNPDTEVKRGVIKTMIAFMEQDSNIGAATCQLVLPDGSLDLAAHRGFPTPLASLLYFLGFDVLYHLRSRDMSKTHQVDAISGSFFLTRKTVLDKVGIFDEDYFMYAEDLDLCFRIKQAGYKIMYVPRVKILHLKGVSSGLKRHSQKSSTATIETRQKSLDSFYSTMKIFYQKHYQAKYPSFVNLLVHLGINLKWWLAKRSLTV